MAKIATSEYHALLRNYFGLGSVTGNGPSVVYKRPNLEIHQKQTRREQTRLGKSDLNVYFLNTNSLFKLVQVSHGIAYIHSKGIVHADIRAVRIYNSLSE